ncbi:electron transfer flavoprotein subunit beta/FixA family protein [Spiractinospora alimapuensis]|uniref:electron transfer flavoprotein subunit beta/FixA family protein n=1 Tax=Spiractinospora alimapuensis TaxID=2820884 RepID=UPI001F30F9B2|nr:electron transfer flavoprotein subunit beta/FixA family protein [Spiractinospora alimapuensis]QVQ51611.1 electron transfer flavoprotein subunit beta/FixA family protein [Spiractinospora alimapuensis]
MNIVVLVKQVPDTENERTLRGDDFTLDRAGSQGVLNELCEYAIEEAMLQKEKHGGEVTVLTMGPEQATETIRKALSMGADKAIHLSDEGLHGSDALQSAYALAKVLEGLEYDVVIMGSESTDARTGVLGAALAEYLGVAQLTQASKVEIDSDARKATVRRVTDDGYAVVEAQLPAVVSVVEKINEPRYPSFKLIMQAKKKPVETLDLAAAKIDPAEVGLAAAATAVADAQPAPARGVGTVVDDEGSGGAKIAEFLASKKFL